MRHANKLMFVWKLNVVIPIGWKRDKGMSHLIQFYFHCVAHMALPIHLFSYLLFFHNSYDDKCFREFQGRERRRTEWKQQKHVVQCDAITMHNTQRTRVWVCVCDGRYLKQVLKQTHCTWWISRIDYMCFVFGFVAASSNNKWQVNLDENEEKHLRWSWLGRGSAKAILYSPDAP